MSSRRALTSLLIAVAGHAVQAPAGQLSDQPPPGKYFKLTAEAHANAASFKKGQPIVGTSYFYWYDVYTQTHFRDGDGTDALTTHPPAEAMDDYSFRSTGWHYRELRDVREAGIDFILPVYWGEPGEYQAWSFAGLPPLVAAHDRMASEHAKDPRVPAPPRIGLFYDTSTLQFNRGKWAEKDGKVDLTTPEGREWFYVTIRDFFSLIPPDKWARIDGRPIVFLYSPDFAAAIDDRLFDDTRQRFRADFATDLFLVRHTGWPGRADAWYQWGGALGLTVGDVVAGLGPGYDHSAVPGRSPLVVDRQGGKFYERQWELLLRMPVEHRPWIVHVETWNEWHEGTNVARSATDGDREMKTTARYAETFRRRVRLEPSGPFANAPRVRWSAREVAGLTLLPTQGDGKWKYEEVDGTPAVASLPAQERASFAYLYFDVDDSYLYAEIQRTVEVSVVFRDDQGCEGFCIDYDGRNPEAGPVQGAFRPTRTFTVGNTGTWRTITVQLPDVQFTNRANRADFRLAVTGGSGRLVVREVIVRKLPGETR